VPPGIVTTEPLGYLDFVCLMKHAWPSSRIPEACRRRPRALVSLASPCVRQRNVR
jgi:hypothetical protein